MHNLTVRFKSERETERMIDFLQKYGHLLDSFKNDNNNISGKLDIVFSYALEHQVPPELRKQFINIKVVEVAPYIWRLACWMSFRSQYRMNLDPVLYFDDELFKLVIHPTGRESEIHITPDGMVVEKGLNATWKFLQRNKEFNEQIFNKFVSAWSVFESENN